MTSFPVPVSPAIRTVIFVGATASTRERMPRRLPRRPTIVSTNGGSSRSSLRARSSRRYAMAFIGICRASSLIGITELEAELIFHPYVRAHASCVMCCCDCKCSFYRKRNQVRLVHCLCLRALARFSFHPFSPDPLSDVKAAVFQLDRVDFPLLQNFYG